MFCYVWGLLINWFIFVDYSCVCVINVPVTVQCLAAVRCLIGDVISVAGISMFVADGLLMFLLFCAAKFVCLSLVQ